MRRTINPRESNVMNVKDMVTSEQNVPHFSRNKRKAWMCLSLMKITQKEKWRVNLLNMSLLCPAELCLILNHVMKNQLMKS